MTTATAAASGIGNRYGIDHEPGRGTGTTRWGADRRGPPATPDHRSASSELVWREQHPGVG